MRSTPSTVPSRSRAYRNRAFVALRQTQLMWARLEGFPFGLGNTYLAPSCCSVIHDRKHFQLEQCGMIPL